MDKRKILFFHHSPALGGAGISGLNVVKAIPKCDFEVIVYCNSQGGPMPDIFRNSGFEVIKAGKSPVVFKHFSGGESFALSPYSIMNYINVIFDIRHIREIITQIKPDVVIVNSMTLFWIGKIAKRKAKKTICFFRETYTHGLFGIRTSLIKYYLGKYFDAISFISTYDLKENMDLKSKKITIYNAIQPQFLNSLKAMDHKQRLGFSKKYFYVLFVGGMSPLKGAIVAIRAIKAIPNSRIKLVFVGYEWKGRKKELADCRNVLQKIKFLVNLDYEKKCLDQIIDDNLSGRIQFFPTNQNLAPFYAACDVLIFPATRAHQGRPLFEAGMAQIPVIASDFPNIREFINEKTGFLFENSNVMQLADLIKELANKPQNAKNRVEENYRATIERHSTQIFNESIGILLNSIIF